MMKIIDANEAVQLKGYVLFVLYAPGCYAPCPSIFASMNESDAHEGRTVWAAHFTALYEAVEYVEEMKHRRLVGADSKLFVRNEEGFIVWRNDVMREANARYLAALTESDKEESAA